MADKYINIGGHKLTTSKDVQYKQKTLSNGCIAFCWKAGNVVTVAVDGSSLSIPTGDNYSQLFDSTETDWRPRRTVYSAAYINGSYNYMNLIMSRITEDGRFNFWAYSVITSLGCAFTYISQG